MPILNCYTSKTNLQANQWDRFVESWAKIISVDKKDISIHVIADFFQVGERYELKAELYLPSLWSDNAVIHIQQSFLTLAEKMLKIKQSDIFLMTQIIQSGHVIDRGKTEEW